MRIKEKIDVHEFLKRVHDCGGEVVFLTTEGDSLNLKSALSKYLFAAVSNNEELMKRAKIVCNLEEDYRILMPFLQEE